MPATPWRIACQSYTILNDEKEPIVTLQFDVNHAAADAQLLRIAPQDLDQPALEIRFATGGFPVEPAVVQPRWLKPFERVDPNLHLDDDDAWSEYAEGLGEEQRTSMSAKHDAYMKRREAWHDARSGDKPAPDQEFDRVYGGGERKERPYDEADNVPAQDPSRYPGSQPAPYNPSPGGVQQPAGADDNSPGNVAVQEAQSQRAGVENTTPSPQDQKGMVGQGTTPSTRGKVVDTGSLKGRR